MQSRIRWARSRHSNAAVAFVRGGAYLLVAVAAGAEIRRRGKSQTATAVESERRRLARDLHDGVVQELGYIRSEAMRSQDGEVVARIGAAADRAIDEARRTISALLQDPDEGLAGALARAACEIGDRYDVPVHVSLDESVTVSPAMRQDLVRIAREAVTNAARHARAASITVTLSPGSIQVDDAGSGFDTSVDRVGGFGMTSMRERAEGINATVTIDSHIGEGTRVSVTW